MPPSTQIFIPVINLDSSLASDESRFITGINICVDGGIELDRSGLMKDAAEHYAKMGIERVVGMNMGSTGIESVIADLQEDD